MTALVPTLRGGRAFSGMHQHATFKVSETDSAFCLALLSAADVVGIDVRAPLADGTLLRMQQRERST